jgi:hypothetical protein
MFNSLKRGLLSGLILVVTIACFACALALYQMLTAPAPRQPITPSRPVIQPNANNKPPVANDVNKAKPLEVKGTIWLAPAQGERLAHRLEFHDDGTLVLSNTEHTERGKWTTTADGFQGDLQYVTELFESPRELKGVYSDRGLELKVKTSTYFTSGNRFPGKQWDDWAWGWVMQPQFEQTK